MSLTVDFMLTAKCNLACPFCYGPDPDMNGELPLQGKQQLLTELRRRGVTHIVIAGGEPLSSPDAVAVFEAAHDLGLRISLQTNGHFPDRLRRVLPLLDWLALPIDGLSQSTQATMRTAKDQLDRSLAAVSAFNELASRDARLKIGTVVTPINVAELAAMAELVQRLKPAVWKWYQLRPRGAGRVNRDWLHEEEPVIERHRALVQARWPDLPLTVSLVEESRGAYLIVNPDSEALIPELDDYSSLGRLMRPSFDGWLFDETAWQAFVATLDVEAQRRNMDKSFPRWTDS